MAQYVTSKVRTETHTVFGHGKWWLSQEHFDAYKAKKEAYRLKNHPRSRPLIAVTSIRRDELHTVYGHGKWWLNHGDLEEYKNRQALVKRAREAGYDYTQIDEFVEMESNTRDAIRRAKTRERWVRREMTRIKKKYDLPPQANRTHLGKVYERTKDPEVAALLNILMTQSDSDAAKIAHIRKLFLSGKNPYDILYETALLVGISLRKAS